MRSGPLRPSDRLRRTGLRWPTGRTLIGHAPFGAVLAAAVALRVMAMTGYPSVLWFGDSINYLEDALRLRPSPLRPSGYSVLLWALKPLHSLLVVVAVQHVLGLLAGIMVYALVRRFARSRWPDRGWLPGLLAAAVTVPILLDAHQIELEQLLMADALFGSLLVAAVTVAMWRERPPWWTGAVAGLLLGLAAVTKSAGLPLLLVLIVCLAARRSGWRPIAAAVLACAVPVVAYLGWFNAVHGEYALTRTDQIWLYGRTADFADCAKIKPRPEVAVLCPRKPPADPRVAPAYRALWSESALPKIPGGVAGGPANELAGEFARAAILTQPGDYTRVVFRDTFRAFAWKREPYPAPWTFRQYSFPETERILTERQTRTAHAYGGRTSAQRVVEPYAGRLRGYQTWGFLPGPGLGALMAIGLVGVVARARRLGGRVLLPWSAGLALLVIPAATADFDYRYVLTVIPFAALAAGLALIPDRRLADRKPADRKPGGGEHADGAPGGGEHADGAPADRGRADREPAIGRPTGRRSE